MNIRNRIASGCLLLVMMGFFLPDSVLASRRVIGSNGLSITVEPRFRSLSGIGDTARYGATCQFPNQAPFDCTRQVTWSVTDPNLAAFGTTHATRNRLIALSTPGAALVKATLGDAVSNGVLVLVDSKLSNDPVDIFCPQFSPVFCGAANANCSSQRFYSGSGVTVGSFVDFCAVCTPAVGPPLDCTGAAVWDPAAPPFFINDANNMLSFAGVDGQYQIANQGFAEIQVKVGGAPSEDTVTQGAAILTNGGSLTGISLTPAGSVVRDVGGGPQFVNLSATCAFTGFNLAVTPFCATPSTCSCTNSAAWSASRPLVADFIEPKRRPGRLTIATATPAHRGFTKAAASLFGATSPGTVVVVPNRIIQGIVSGPPLYVTNLVGQYTGTYVMTNDAAFPRFYLIDMTDGNIVTSLDLSPANGFPNPGFVVQGILPGRFVGQDVFTYAATTTGKIFEIRNQELGPPGPVGNSVTAGIIFDGPTYTVPVNEITSVMTGNAPMRAMFFGAVRADGIPVFLGVELGDMLNSNGMSFETLLNFPAPMPFGAAERFASSPGVISSAGFPAIVLVPSDFDCPPPLSATGGCAFRFDMPVPAPPGPYPTVTVPTASKAVNGDVRTRSSPSGNRWEIIGLGPLPQLVGVDFSLVDRPGFPANLVSGSRGPFISVHFISPLAEIYFGDEAGSLQCFKQGGGSCFGFPVSLSTSPIRLQVLNLFNRSGVPARTTFGAGSSAGDMFTAVNNAQALFAPGTPVTKDGYPFFLGGSVQIIGFGSSGDPTFLPSVPRSELAVGSDQGVFFIPVTTCTTCPSLPPPSDPPFGGFGGLPIEDPAFWADLPGF